MKLVKSVLSASILAAASQTAVAVETDVSASIRVAYIGGDGHDSAPVAGETGWHDAYSNVTFNASEDLGSTKLSYQFSLWADPTGSLDNDMNEKGVRTHFIQLSGDFGAVSYGENWSPFYNAIIWGHGADRFNGYYTGYNVPGFDSRTTDTVFYSSPNMNGLQISASVGTDATSKKHGERKFEDHREIAVTYQVNDVVSVAAAMTDGAQDEQKDKGIGISYKKDSITLNANYMTTEEGGAWYSGDYTNLYGQYDVNDKTTLRATIGWADEGYVGDSYTLGASHQYSDSVRVFAEYYSDDTGNYPSVGLRVDID